jgi:hypothetical protein
VPFLPYETRKFTTPLNGPDQGRLSLSLAELVWGAMTVGATPISMGRMSRPLIELCWRSTLVAASLEEDPASGRWGMADAYRRLDGTEKGAVSYFLGMMQAKITCQRLLRAPHLIHLDAFLAMVEQPARGPRPDLVGVSLPSLDCAIVVEAKGRTGDKTNKVIEDAKRQLSTPGVLSTNRAVRVASIASFDSRGRWKAYLEEAQGPSQPVTSMTVESLLAAYYRPLVAAQVAAGRRRTTEDDAMTMAEFPGVDLILGIPTEVVAIMRSLPLTGPVTPDQLTTVGARLIDGISPYTVISPKGMPDTEGDDYFDAQELPFYTGLDGIYVELGPTWPQGG